MKVDKLSVSFDPELRAEALVEFLDGWEAKHGALSAEKLAHAAAELGLAAPMRANPAGSGSDKGGESGLVHCSA